MKPTNRREALIEDICKDGICNAKPETREEYWLVEMLKACMSGGGSGGGEQFFVPFEGGMDYIKIGEKQFGCTFDMMNDFYVMADGVFASFIDELNSKVVFSNTEMTVGATLAQIMIETNNGADGYCGGIMITFADESYRVYSQTGSSNAL